MSLWFAFLLMIIEGTITFYVLFQVMSWINTRKSLRFRVGLNRFFSSPVVSFCVNFAISYIIGSFTGSSLVAGFANLASSVIVGIAVPRFIENKFHIAEQEHMLHERRSKKRKYCSDTQNA